MAFAWFAGRFHLHAGFFVYFSCVSCISWFKFLNPKPHKLVGRLLDWFTANARDLPWRRTRDPYAIWVSEIMLQQTQVKTVVPYWKRWMRELPTIAAVAKASPDKIHKLWEGLGYYTRARNLQKAARLIVAQQNAELKSRRRRGDESQTKTKTEIPSASARLRRDRHVVSYKLPDNFEELFALPGVGRYTAGAICSIAFNQPRPILDGNVIRVLTRIFDIGQNPREKGTNSRLWQLAEDLVGRAVPCPPRRGRDTEPYHSLLNQSLMELGAVVCTPRQPQCPICPVKKLCIAFRENRVGELPNLGPRAKTVNRHFIAFIVEQNGRFLVRQRPAGVVNAHLWEFPNTESSNVQDAFKSIFSIRPPVLGPVDTVKHSITRYRITLEAWRATFGGASYTSSHSKAAKSGTRGARPSEVLSEVGVWKTPAQMQRLAFSAAHKKLASVAADCILT